MKVNILVVDDRPEGLLAVEAVLKSPAYNLVMAKSGREALKFLLKDDFAVILLDVQMPEMNGFETAEIIKTREKSKSIPIIFMSAISQEEQYVYRGYEVGAIDYILKPFDPYILKAKVSLFVDLHLKNLQILEQAQRIHDSEIKSYALALDRLELEGLRKYQHLADSIPQIVFRFLPDGSHEYFNKIWFEYTGYSLERSQGKGWRDAVHPEDLSRLVKLLEEGNEVEAECRIKSHSGEYRWHLVRFASERYNDLLQVDAWFGTATDIQERKRDEGFQRLLAEAGRALVSSLDYHVTFGKVAKLVAQDMADYCRIEVLNGNDELEKVASQHKGTEDKELDIFSLDDFRVVLEEGQSVFRPSLTHRDLGECSLIIVPLSAHGRILGTLSLLCRDSRRYDEGELKTAEELGRRVAMVLENSLLYDLSQRAIEARNDFLSIASHELNTPMTSLKLQLEIAKRNFNGHGMSDVGRIEKSISSSLRQVDRLSGLIQVLFDVSKIHSGKFDYAFAETTVHEVLHEVMERNKEIFSSAGCELYVSDVPHTPVQWDKLRIEQVIINLLNNAMKYAPGRIELNVSAGEGNVRIEVRDYGKGIEKEKIKTIFDRFSRATGHSVAGMGLGLYIVKQIVEGHEGRIDVESSDKGSRFIVTLPHLKEDLKIPEKALKELPSMV